MVVFAIAIGVTRSITNSGVHERNTVALTVGDHEISNAELNYFYMSAINNFNSNYGSYAAMLGLDTSKPLNEQVINNDTGLTWADDFLNTAKDSARSAYALADAAEAAGFTLSEDDLADIDSTISNMKLYANLYGYSSTKDFLKAQYGNGATEESYRQYVTLNALASAYRNSYSSSLTYTDADLRAAESENYEKYSSFTYNTYYLAASKFQTDEVDADSDEAVKAAKEAADSLIGEDVATVEDFDAAIAALDVNRDTEASSTAYTDQQYSSVSATIRDWVIDSARKEGDKTVIANTSTSTDDDGKETTTTQGYYAVFFTGSNDNTFPLVNVRHILIKFEGGTTDSTTGTTTYSAEEKPPRIPSLLWPTRSPTTATAPPAACTRTSTPARWCPASTTGASTKAARPATPASSSPSTATMLCTSWARAIPPTATTRSKPSCATPTHRNGMTPRWRLCP